eukprot:CAMPEP_0206030340 /NCGR_PEP_ID=MMETSP1464-20131121/47466_1 /ASSEMBLY_ACC=CAM_ASM_001124 /TAXON_ID=119497 /ORGANISM="Exanthemachrysis gayraliae, Strain RCC1523" /LENGTH=743 /DNA_ID=CAMNT_0053404445 /DNA_START=55 /DNA_END=2286 /DNA_ORIENTATION=-
MRSLLAATRRCAPRGQTPLPGASAGGPTRRAGAIWIAFARAARSNAAAARASGSGPCPPSALRVQRNRIHAVRDRRALGPAPTGPGAARPARRPTRARPGRRALVVVLDAVVYVLGVFAAHGLEPAHAVRAGGVCLGLHLPAAALQEVAHGHGLDALLLTAVVLLGLWVRLVVVPTLFGERYEVQEGRGGPRGVWYQGVVHHATAVDSPAMFAQILVSAPPTSRARSPDTSAPPLKTPSAMFAQILVSALAFNAPALKTRTAAKSSVRMAVEDELGVLPPLGFWDPLGLSEDESRFERRRAVEIKHGRICMAAVVGYLVPEVYKFDYILVPNGDPIFGGGSLSGGLSTKDIPPGVSAFSYVPSLGWLQILFFIIAPLEISIASRTSPSASTPKRPAVRGRGAGGAGPGHTMPWPPCAALASWLPHPMGLPSARRPGRPRAPGAPRPRGHRLTGRDQRGLRLAIGRGRVAARSGARPSHRGARRRKTPPSESPVTERCTACILAERLLDVFATKVAELAFSRVARSRASELRGESSRRNPLFDSQSVTQWRHVTWGPKSPPYARATPTSASTESLIDRKCGWNRDRRRKGALRDEARLHGRRPVLNAVRERAELATPEASRPPALAALGRAAETSLRVANAGHRAGQCRAAHRATAKAEARSARATRHVRHRGAGRWQAERAHGTTGLQSPGRCGHASTDAPAAREPRLRLGANGRTRPRRPPCGSAARARCALAAGSARAAVA